MHYLSKSAYIKKGLQSHVNLSHDMGFRKAVKCVLCNYETTRPNSLLIHVNNKHKELYKYSCSQCVFKTNHKKDFGRHKNTVHDDTTISQKKIQCHLCSFESIYRQSIKIHLNEFHEIRRKKS